MNAMNTPKFDKVVIVLMAFFTISASNYGITQNESGYQVGFGFDVGYRSPYANNNWLSGIAVDLNVHASKRIGNWAPEIYVRRNVFNMTDAVEYPLASVWEVGATGNYYLAERHVFFGGVGANIVSYQGYDYSESEGWTERTKKDRKLRLAYQIGYQFNFINRQKFEAGIQVGYHSIRKLQVGFDFNFNL